MAVRVPGATGVAQEGRRCRPCALLPHPTLRRCPARKEAGRTSPACTLPSPPTLRRRRPPFAPPAASCRRRPRCGCCGAGLVPGSAWRSLRPAGRDAARPKAGRNRCLGPLFPRRPRLAASEWPTLPPRPTPLVPPGGINSVRCRPLCEGDGGRHPAAPRRALFEAGAGLVRDVRGPCGPRFLFFPRCRSHSSLAADGVDRTCTDGACRAPCPALPRPVLATRRTGVLNKGGGGGANGAEFG